MEMLRISSPVMPMRPQVRPSAPEGRSTAGVTPDAAAANAAPAALFRPIGSAQNSAETSENNAAVDRERLEQTVSEINARLGEISGSSIQFTVDDDLGDVIVRVVDKQTDEVLRQIPPEEVVALRKRMAEMRGILIDRQG